MAIILGPEVLTQRPSAGSNVPPKVLLVDDDPDTLSSLGALFRREIENIQVEVATTALEAFKLMEGEGAAVVISDLKMAGLDGMLFLARLRRSHPKTLRVLYTAVRNPTSIVGTLDVGDAVVVWKGADPEELLRVVRAHVRSWPAGHRLDG